ncbi:MAG: hypothetical protein ACR2MB_06925 [Acidimicrobiales bacterium]
MDAQELAEVARVHQELLAAVATDHFEALVARFEAIEADDPVDRTSASSVAPTWAAIHGVAEVLLLGFGADDGAIDDLFDEVVNTMLAGQIRPLRKGARRRVRQGREPADPTGGHDK